MSNVFRVVLVALLIATFGLTSNSLSHNAQAQLGDICVVFDVAGPGDLSFNDSAILGANRAAAELGFGTQFIENASTDDFLPNLTAASESGECALIAAIGFLLGDALNQVSAAFPDQDYLIIDSVVDQPNVQSVLFDAHVGSALVGALAVNVNNQSRGDTAGGAAIVLGIPIPVLFEFECGFYYGARWADNGGNNGFDGGDFAKTTPLAINYTGSFIDPALGREAADTFLNEGFNVLYNVAGGTGAGMISAVGDFLDARGRDQGPPVAIGVDSVQDYLGGGGVVLTSMLKRVDQGVFQGAAAISDGSFTGGIISLGLTDGGIALSTPEDLDAFVSIGVAAGVLDEADVPTIKARNEGLRTVFIDAFAVAAELEAAILAGDVTVPQASDNDAIEACRATYN